MNIFFQQQLAMVVGDETHAMLDSANLLNHFVSFDKLLHRLNSLSTACRICDLYLERQERKEISDYISCN